MNFQSIHSLIAAISLPKLRGYLQKNGWSEFEAQGKWTFSKKREGSGELSSVFLPSDTKHSRYRSLLQNLLFSLSVLEGREPSEIATDILQTAIQEPSSTETATNNSVSRPMVSIFEAASLVRDIARECQDSEAARGKVFELAAFVLKLCARELVLEKDSDAALWETARTDLAYLPVATKNWLMQNSLDRFRP